MTNNRLTITALITTFNSAKTLYKALKSVDWCDEILVVDSFSTDETLEIAAQFGSKIVQRKIRAVHDSSNTEFPYRKMTLFLFWILMRR